MDSGLAFEEKAFLSAERLTIGGKTARKAVDSCFVQERWCFKMSENPLEFGMECVAVKLALCYVFQWVLFFVVYEDHLTIRSTS